MSGRGRNVGGRDRDVGCCGRDLGGRDRSVGPKRGRPGPQRGRPGPQRGWPGGGFCVSAVSVAEDGWERGQQGPYRRVLWSRGRRRTWSVASRRLWASCRAVSELSPAPGGRLGRPAARGRTRSLNRGWVCTRRRERRSQKTCAARTKGGGGWYPTLGLICRRRLRAVGRLAAHSNDVEGHIDPWCIET
jgi:hypothetical protein